jgi:signal transduction histidine kinase/CheY-like chemotaxis protein
MLDRLADPSDQPFDALEPLPPQWRDLVEALREQLSRAIEQREWLARALERTSSELHEQVVELEALRRARTAAESANLVRGEMLATISRTMRTPADALLGLTGVLRLGALLPVQRSYVEALTGAAEVLRGILNNVSDFSRLENGTLPLEPIGFDLRVMIEDLAAVLGGEAHAKGITLRLAWRPEAPRRVTGDPGRIRQVLTALVRDALARMERGEVVLEVGEDVARPAGSGIRVTVEDSGPAIPPDLLPTLFEPFVRGDAYANRDGALALPIARSLARLMGGDIGVQNATDGGTRFMLRLPLARLEAQEGGEAGSAAPRDSVPSSALPGTLLVVDADANQRASWASIAEAAGYRASGFASREEAIAELKRRAAAGQPAGIVMFSDHDAEGYHTIGRDIVTDPSLGKPALIMLPAAGNPGDARRLMDAGFRGYLVKPIAPADLRETLETLRRTPRSGWHRLFLTRHSLAEARRGGEVGDEEVEAGLGMLVDQGISGSGKHIP